MVNKGEAELRTTCDTNMSDYKNQLENEKKKKLFSIEIARYAQNMPTPLGTKLPTPLEIFQRALGMLQRILI